MTGFFEALNSAGNLKRDDIIEKDFHLHRVLGHMSNDDYFRKNLVFKGGTCLIKAYMDYYRFSEDLDFTWMHKEIWEDLSKSQSTKICSSEISVLCERFKNISDELGLNFSGDKSKVDEVHISSGGRMVFFKLGYESEVLRVPSHVKIEVNFVEKVLFPYSDNDLKSYVEDVKSDEIRYLYEYMWNEYNRPVVYRCYDPREIFIEKCRASLTRIKYKLRDALDIYFMENKLGLTIMDLRKEIIDKTAFIIDLYQRYGERIEMESLPPADVFSSKELDLLLVEPPSDFQSEVERIHSELDVIRSETINSKI